MPRLTSVLSIGLLSIFGAFVASPATAQNSGTSPAKAGAGARTATVATAPVTPPTGYVIGPDDILEVTFWRDKDLSGEVVVRPDGKIALPLLNELQAAGLTPEQLRVVIGEAADRYVEDPTVSVVVKKINSLKVFITGQVAHPGAYSLLGGGTTVLQLISMAGGLQEYADEKNIIVVRTENARQFSYRFNYRDLTKRINLKQNIELKPGDTVVVP